jgi:hypothetical protein
MYSLILDIVSPLDKQHEESSEQNGFNDQIHIIRPVAD